MRGLAHHVHRSWREALDDYSRSLELKSKALTLLNRGGLYLQLGDLRNAERDAASARLATV
jgi:regulator of sirC expression with transglutaminase-like and TPR domain